MPSTPWGVLFMGQKHLDWYADRGGHRPSEKAHAILVARSGSEILWHETYALIKILDTKNWIIETIQNITYNLYGAFVCFEIGHTYRWVLYGIMYPVSSIRLNYPYNSSISTSSLQSVQTPHYSINCSSYKLNIYIKFYIITIYIDIKYRVF